MFSQELLVILIGLACIAIVLILIYLSRKKKKSTGNKESEIDPFKGAEDIDALAEYNKMNAASESKRDGLAKQYAGRRVIWNITYDSIVKIDDGSMLVMGLYKGDYPWIYFNADTKRYAFIKDIVQGQKLMLTGTIEKYDYGDGGFTVELEELKIL